MLSLGEVEEAAANVCRCCCARWPGQAAPLVPAETAACIFCERVCAGLGTPRGGIWRAASGGVAAGRGGSQLSSNFRCGSLAVREPALLNVGWGGRWLNPLRMCESISRGDTSFSDTGAFGEDRVDSITATSQDRCWFACFLSGSSSCSNLIKSHMDQLHTQSVQACND